MRLAHEIPKDAEIENGQLRGKRVLVKNKTQKEGGYDMRRQLRVQRKARFRAAPQDR
jgi:hypothetical protein